MTHNDYELIARSVFRSQFAASVTEKRKPEAAAAARSFRLVAIDLAASLAHDNPSFDRASFMAACGVQS